MSILFRRICAVLLMQIPLLSFAEKHDTASAKGSRAPIKSISRLHVAADVWCPYNCEPGTSLPGYMVEILRESISSQVRIDDYRYSILPWNRALKTAENGTIDAVIAATEGEAQNLNLPMYHIGTTKDALYVHHDSDFTYDGIANIVENKLKVGLITEYEYSDSIQELKEHYPSLIFEARGEEPLDQLLLLLERNKIDLLVEDPAVFQYISRNEYLLGTFKQVALLGKPVKLYIAFHSKEMAELFDRGYAEIVKTGKVEEILKKYSIEHWGD